MPSIDSSTILVVGAGPTGMTAAIELKRAGLDVCIIDKSSHAALHSQALVVQSRTLEQWQRYGIAAKAVACGRKLTDVKFWSDAKNILTFSFDQIPSVYKFVLFLLQSDTEALLNEHMQSLGVYVERATELTSIAQHDGKLTARLRHADGKTESLETRWLIGCDGAYSTVRDKMNIPFEGGGVGLSFFLGDLAIDGPDAPDNELAIHLRHGDVAFMGKLSDRLTRLIVALHSKQNDGDQVELSIQDFQNAVDQVGVRVKIHAAEWMTPFRVNDRQAAQYRACNVFLAGDAYHIHSPVGGQGMNTGIQDAANLAWKLAALARGADDSLLDSYERERAEVGRALLRSTGRGLKLATSANPLVEMARDILAPILNNFHPFQRSVVGFISETAISYRDSPIGADHGGDGSLRAGDRLPDLPTSQGSTLLQHWTNLRHLAILINATPAETEELASSLPHAETLLLQTSDLDAHSQSLLGENKKLFILRPDGYIGFRGPVENRAGWLDYAHQDKLTA